ncbi:MAG TPA: NAD-dependent deacylase [Hyphomicrobiaceae bacterium]|nr:NAD-dependent deacylase [Hyphomicrobiaceae bacterium]
MKSLTSKSSILVLTGAGISKESGLDTFRDADGLWAKVRIEDVATPEAFERNPSLVQDFYNKRRQGMAGVRPNAAHLALARLEKAWPGAFRIVTQNIDNLHEAAGSRRVVHMHGELLKALCRNCRGRHPWMGDLGADVSCPTCRKAGGMRPDVVWFGEQPYHMEEISWAVMRADLFISIGTSGNVYPAAGFVATARSAGAYTVELNLEPSDGASSFHECRHGRATEIVPTFVDEVLAALKA